MANEPEQTPIRVGVYARISVDPDGTQTATVRQLADCREFAERRGWEVAEVFEDVDTSAYQPKAKRPQFECLATRWAAWWRSNCCSTKRTA